MQEVREEKVKDEEEDITKEEIEMALRKMKDGKAVGGNGIPAEV